MENIPDSLWKALALLLGSAFFGMLIFVLKNHLSKMDKMFEEFTKNITSIMIKDAVQDNKLENHEVRIGTLEDHNRNMIVRYRD